MPKELQLEILGEFRGLPRQMIAGEQERFGELERDGRRLNRFRVGDYRVYFERHDLGVVVHRILRAGAYHQRFSLSLRLAHAGEDEALQENPKFWELIEAATSVPKGKAS